MLRTLAYTALCSAALIGSSAYGADNPTVPANQPAQAQAQAPSGVTFVAAQEKDQWRAPKLIGVGVYGPDDKQLGKIDDLLINRDGSAQTVVIGVGGFLGFGKKDVAVPFCADPVADGSAKSSRASGRSAPILGRQSGRSRGATVPQPAMKEVDPATAAAAQGYPDKAVLNVTLDQLKAAPDFKYASSTVAESEMRPTTDQQMKKTTP